MDSLCGEPVSLWLPEQYKKPNTSTYVQGVEVSLDYSKPIPEGFDTILLPKADYLMFQGEPFREEDFGNTIVSVQQAMYHYKPEIMGHEWDNSNSLNPVLLVGILNLKRLNAYKIPKLYRQHNFI